MRGAVRSYRLNRPSLRMPALFVVKEARVRDIGDKIEVLVEEPFRGSEKRRTWV